MFDSLVIDLMFSQGAPLDPEVLVTALGGEEEASQRKILDPDMQDPRLEMEMSPSRPFRRRAERRLFIIDDSVAPMRADPQTDFKVPLDLRPERERLISLCTAMNVRLGRIFALGTWGDAVLIARSARDLRGIALLSWALDPTVDVDGNPYGRRLTQAEFETKLAAYEKRLDELDEQQILSKLDGVNIERRGELIILDVLEDDGTWNMRRSPTMERLLASTDRFSMIVGAPYSAEDKPDGEPDAADTAGRTLAPADAAAGHTRADTAETAAAGAGGRNAAGDSGVAAISTIELAGRLVLVFALERFDLDIAASLGKRDYESIIVPADGFTGTMRDRLYREGAEFVAPVEFYSEVFLDGKPLSRPQFDSGATPLSDGVRAMEVHCPRYGRVQLVVGAGAGKFMTSVADLSADDVSALQAALAAHG